MQMLGHLVSQLHSEHGALAAARRASKGLCLDRVTVVIVIFGAAAVLTGTSNANASGAGGPVDDGSGAVWRAERACGANSLYIVLRLAGKHPAYEELSQMLVKDKAPTLDELRRAARYWGVDLALARLTREELRRAPLPLIAHFEGVGSDGRFGGHFVVVVETNDSEVNFIDGTHGGALSKSWHDFGRLWSGYVAYAEPHAFRWGIVPGALSGVVAFSLGWIVVGVIRGRMKGALYVLSDFVRLSRCMPRREHSSKR
jgi:hypothetical protein